MPSIIIIAVALGKFENNTVPRKKEEWGSAKGLRIYLHNLNIPSLIIIILFIQVYCPYATLGYERPTPQSLTSIRTHKRNLGNYPH
jgi:hypothetical protein